MTATATATVVIDEPGLYPTVTAEQYHADPVAGGSLSSSGARRLLPPSCPARFRYDQLHGQAPKAHYDLGHAAHRAVLGVGAGVHVIDAPDWRTKAAKEERDEARAAGHTPLLTHDAETVEAMAAAIRAHPVASAILTPGSGTPEATIVWQDQGTGIWCRAMIDWLPNGTAGRRLVVPDYKTANAADPETLSRAFHQHGYHQQDDWYTTAVESLGHPDPAFVFVCQEKTAPYLVTVVELDTTAKQIGAVRNQWARSVYARCTETGHWPGYVDGVHLLSLPRWAELQEGIE